MVSALISRMVILLFGTLYPAYASYKAVRTKNVKEYVKWMMYWIIFALFTCVETFSDMFIAWIPFYYEIKIIFVLWLLSPVTKGSSYLYRKFVHPQFLRREKEIDDCIAKASDKGYTTLISLGSKGVAFATNVVLQTAIKGQSKLADQIRKSYSMNDINSPASGERRMIEDSPHDSEDELDNYEDADNRLIEDNRELEIRDQNNHNRHSKIKRSSSSAGALYSVAEHTDEEGESSVTKDYTTHYGTMRRAPRTRSTYSHTEAYHYGTLPRNASLHSKRYYAPSSSLFSPSSTTSLYPSTSSTLVGQYTSYTPSNTSSYLPSSYTSSYLPTSWRTRQNSWWR